MMPTAEEVEKARTEYYQSNTGMAGTFLGMFATLLQVTERRKGERRKGERRKIANTLEPNALRTRSGNDRRQS